MAPPLAHTVAGIRAELIKTLELILEKGASIAHRNTLGITALHEAAFKVPIPDRFSADGSHRRAPSIRCCFSSAAEPTSTAGQTTTRRHYTMLCALAIR